jgi:hypothetical protein
MLGTQVPNERRLPDACLAADEHQPAMGTTDDNGQVFVERRDLVSAFEQSDRRIGRDEWWLSWRDLPGRVR